MNKCCERCKIPQVQSNEPLYLCGDVICVCHCPACTPGCVDVACHEQKHQRDQALKHAINLKNKEVAREQNATWSVEEAGDVHFSKLVTKVIRAQAPEGATLRYLEMPYNQTDHEHCWETKSPPCGMKGKHLQCCLCGKASPLAPKVPANWDGGDVGTEATKEDWEVEKLSAEFHDIYQKEAHRQEDLGLGPARHYDEYEKLSEPVKEFDRVLARYVLKLLEQAKEEKKGQTKREWYQMGFDEGKRAALEATLKMVVTLELSEDKEDLRFLRRVGYNAAVDDITTYIKYELDK